MTADNRKPGLDLVRSLAILLVLGGHGAMLLPSDPATAEWRAGLLYVGGYFGVEIFFALSGYLIVGLLLRQIEVQQGLGWSGALRFWRRRWWRTLPNYFLFLLLNATLFMTWFGGPDGDARYLLFMQNLAWPHPGFMAEAWSLAVEEWFYLLLPLLLLAVLARGTSPRVAMLMVLVALVVLSALGRVVVADLAAPAWDAGMRKVVVLRLDAIAWGGLVAYALHYHASRTRQLRNISLVVGLAALLLSGAWLLHGVASRFTPINHYVWLFTLTSLGVALCLPAADAWQAGREMLSRGLSFVSRVSYSTYLVHFSFVIPLLRLPWAQNHLPLLARLTLYLILSLGLAWIVYRYYELPLLRLREQSLMQRLYQQASRYR